MKRFDLKKSITKEGYWVLTDTQHLVVCIFEEGRYNETNEFEFINNVDSPNVADLAKIAREMGEYVAIYHPGKAFKNVYGFERSEEYADALYLCRYKPPMWRLEIQQGAGLPQVASSLKKAAEWLLKGGQDGDNK